LCSLSNLALLVHPSVIIAGDNPQVMTMNAHGGDDAFLRYPHSGLLVDSLPLGIVFQDLKGQIRAANPAAETILGLTLDQMRGVTSVDPRWHAVHEDGTPFPGEEHPAMVALQTGESVDSVVMGIFNPQRDALAWISVSARLVPNEQTQGVRGVYAIFEDITQRKQAEQEIQALHAGLEQRVAERTASLAAEIAERQRLTEQLSVREAHYRRLNADLEHHAEERIAQIRAAVAALRESEARYRAAFEGSLDAIVISRLEDGVYLDVNQGFVDISGHERDAALGRTGIELNIWADPRARGALIDQVRKLQKVQNFETVFRRKNGEEFWGLMAVTQIEFDGIPCLLSVTRDISERKQLEQALRQARDAAEAANQALREANAELNQLATTDSLTGIWNRRYFEQATTFEIARTLRYGDPLSVVMFDIDHFKAINDRYGHLTGDAVLVALSHRVRQHLRTVDVLARWGGEEFVVMLPHCGARDALNLAEKLRALIANQPFPPVGSVTSSFGVAPFQTQDTLDDWLKRADDALYEAKAAGRNRVHQAQ
jgi:diguanylate cyclase (GGDEF)-like protein/PAS domain S-box-containing protein